tara:strand:- start:59 stop:367 length:309 start_codon:yes stop_codon:yes gene_type:complete
MNFGDVLTVTLTLFAVIDILGSIPIIAGSGTLTTLISLRSTYTINDIIVGVLVNLVFVYIVLKSTGKIERLLGKGGINVLRRVFGIVLLAIAIKLTKMHLVF